MKLQKLTLIVSLAQTALLVWLALKLVGLQNDVDKISAFETQVDRSPHAMSTRPAPQPSAFSGLEAAELRSILRSELDAFAVDVLSGEQKPATNTREISKAAETDPVELARLQAEVRGQLDLLHSGAVPTQAELARLEQNIARLPPGQREDAVKRMFNSVNQGKVDITF